MFDSDKSSLPENSRSKFVQLQPVFSTLNKTKHDVRAAGRDDGRSAREDYSRKLVPVRTQLYR